MAYINGDIGAVLAEGFAKVAGLLSRKIFTPHTDLFHFFLIGDYIPEENDYVILEATPRGVMVGRLSWYEGYRIFRVVDPDVRELGIRAARAATKYGRAYYDYLLFFKLLAGVMRCLFRQLMNEGWFKAIRPAELPYARDSRFICTEIANEAWRLVGRPIVPKGVVPLPAGFIEALNSGKLVEVT